MTFDGTLCLYNGKKIIVPQAQPEGIFAHYNFDEQQIIDNSGNQNHMLNDVPRGPGHLNDGNSALLHGDKFLEIQNSSDFDDKNFSIQFWVYLIQGFSEGQTRSRQWCPIFQKGLDNLSDNQFYRSPAIFLNTQDRNLKVYITTNDQNNNPLGEEMISTARISYNMWYNIVLTKNGDKVKLYLNGILDSVLFLSEFSVANDHNFYVGNTPALQDECSIPMYIDDLKIYNKVLQTFEIQAETTNIAGIEPAALHFGCINCDIEKAKNSCVQGYHLCTNLEIYSGIYQVARIMGWTEWNNNIWSYNNLLQIDQNNQQQNSSDTIDTGLGICCKDILQ